jgi:small subunit ribosomal protein S1
MLQEHDLVELLSMPMPARNPRRGSLIMAEVLSVGRSGALVSFGGKSDAIVPPRETGDNLSVGQHTLFVVTGGPDDNETVIASRRLAELWEELEDARASGHAVTIKVTQVVKRQGELCGVRAVFKKKGVCGFVPASLLGYDAANPFELLDKSLLVKVRDVDAPQRLIFDRRQAEQDEAVSTLAAGDEVTGSVKSIAANDAGEYGLFVDIGRGACGLVHRSEIAQSEKLLSERFPVGSRVDVQVLGVQERAGRKLLSLSVKRLQQRRFVADLQVGEVLVGVVVNTVDYGVFVSLSPDVRGRVHRSQLPAAVRNGKRALQKGDSVNVRVERIDLDRLQVGLSMRDVSQEQPA